MFVGRAAARPDVCPQPTSGATVRLVCTLSFPLPGAGLTVEWCGPCLGHLHTARLVVLWICCISWGRSARCTEAVRPLRFCKPDLGTLPCRAGCPSTAPAPFCQSVECAPPLALPTLFRGPLVYAWLQRVRSAHLRAVFWVI